MCLWDRLLVKGKGKGKDKRKTTYRREGESRVTGENLGGGRWGVETELKEAEWHSPRSAHQSLWTSPHHPGLAHRLAQRHLSYLLTPLFSAAILLHASRNGIHPFAVFTLTSRFNPSLVATCAGSVSMQAFLHWPCTVINVLTSIKK